MTVIAFADGVMASDSQLTGGTLVSRAQKIWRLPDGGVIGGAGTFSQVYAGAQWVASGERGEVPDISGAVLLIARPDGSLSVADGGFPAYPLLDGYAAVGCGSDAAVGALRAGASPVEAVASVIGQNASCGWPVQSMEVVSFELPDITFHEEPKRAPRKRK
jgi:hypothetical protein